MLCGLIDFLLHSFNERRYFSVVKRIQPLNPQVIPQQEERIGAPFREVVWSHPAFLPGETASTQFQKRPARPWFCTHATDGIEPLFSSSATSCAVSAVAGIFAFTSGEQSP